MNAKDESALRGAKTVLRELQTLNNYMGMRAQVTHITLRYWIAALEWTVEKVRELDARCTPCTDEATEYFQAALNGATDELKVVYARAEKAEAEVRKLRQMVCCHYEDMQRAHDQRRRLEAEVERLREAIKAARRMLKGKTEAFISRIDLAILDLLKAALKGEEKKNG